MDKFSFPALLAGGVGVFGFGYSTAWFFFLKNPRFFCLLEFILRNDEKKRKLAKQRRFYKFLALHRLRNDSRFFTRAE
jgi:hypothetical protein